QQHFSLRLKEEAPALSSAPKAEFLLKLFPEQFA
ncbi:hypothetical protein DBR06_SOUSAS32010009, partial [Sousa chinensis]